MIEIVEQHQVRSIRPMKNRKQGHDDQRPVACTVGRDARRAANVEVQLAPDDITMRFRRRILYRGRSNADPFHRWNELAQGILDPLKRLVIAELHGSEGYSRVGAVGFDRSLGLYIAQQFLADARRSAVPLHRR